ncbi:unnamed protein product [Arctogadus glacialis]
MSPWRGALSVKQLSSVTGLASALQAYWWWPLGAAQYNHRGLLVVDTGSCPVQPQRPTGGRHWELPSTTTEAYWWWPLGAAQYNHRGLLVVATGSCPVQPQRPTGGGHWELPSTTTEAYWWWPLGAAQYNHRGLLVPQEPACDWFSSGRAEPCPAYQEADLGSVSGETAAGSGDDLRNSACQERLPMLS